MAEDTAEIRKFICIRCPTGCEVSAHLDHAGNIVEVTGNRCRLGVEHVQAEMTHPTRTLTTTVTVLNGEKPLVPVWTQQPIPKAKMMELTHFLRFIQVEAPIQIGQVIVADALGTGIAVIASGLVKHK